MGIKKKSNAYWALKTTRWPATTWSQAMVPPSGGSARASSSVLGLGISDGFRSWRVRRASSVVWARDKS